MRFIAGHQPNKDENKNKGKVINKFEIKNAAAPETAAMATANQVF